MKIWGYEHMLDEGTWNTQIVDEIFPGEVNEFVVTKHSHDPFFHTDLDDILRKLVPKPTEYYAVVTGVTSNVAFLEAVAGFHVRDYWTIAPIDCTAGPEDLHEETFRKFETWSHWNVFPSRSDHLSFGPVV